MRFRLGLALGFAGGYVLGAKAGQERYEQIVELVSKARSSEAGQELEHGLRDAVQTAKDEFEERASEGMEEVTSIVRQATEHLDDATDRSS